MGVSFILSLIGCDRGSRGDTKIESNSNNSILGIEPLFVIDLANIYGRIFRESFVYDDIRTVNLDNNCTESFPSGGITGLNGWFIKLYDEDWNLVTSGYSYSDYYDGAGWFQLGNVDAPGVYNFIVTDAYGNIYMGLEYGESASNYQWSVNYPQGYNSCTAINCTGSPPSNLVYPEFADSRVIIHHEEVSSWMIYVDIFIQNLSPVLSVTTSGKCSFRFWNNITLAPGDSCRLGARLFSKDNDIYVYARITSSSPLDQVSSNNFRYYSREGNIQN
ncbi:MAG: hypothetical protein KAU06_11645 [Candidatus Marinimicrobia bacterium]|nr:hypothetical protein [Candidatus Neomarinimicrobiota bacterium]